MSGVIKCGVYLQRMNIDIDSKQSTQNQVKSEDKVPNINQRDNIDPIIVVVSSTSKCIIVTSVM